MADSFRFSLLLLLSVITQSNTSSYKESSLLSRHKRGASSISIGPPTVYKGPGNHTVEVGQNFQFYCKIKANPLAHVAIKFNPVDGPVRMVFPKYGSSPTGGSTIVLLDLIDLQLEDEGRYTCFGENKYGTVEAHGWLKFAKACNCNQFGVAFPQKPCDDNGNCVCRENVGGDRCDECQEGFFNYPFCQPCECNPWGTIDQSLSCDQKTGECNCLPDRSIFDSIKCDGCQAGDFFNVVTSKCQPCQCYPHGSVSKDCDYISGKCECKDNFVGDKCSLCKDGFYSRDDGCKPCECVVTNTLRSDGRCDSETGQCLCKPGLDYTDPRTCASCPADTYYNNDDCVSCGCDPTGSVRCDVTGRCVCRENHTGNKCQQCQANHYGHEHGLCSPCECNAYGTVGGTLQCDKDGDCPCKEGQGLIDSRHCDGCPPGKTISQNSVEEVAASCEDCKCNPMGSISYQCDLYTGECECKPGVLGLHCDACKAGSYGFATFGECRKCACDPVNSLGPECDEDSGQCPCLDNIVFTDTRTCTGCPAGQYSNEGACQLCACNKEGSVSAQCDDNGQCICHTTVQGLKCDQCKPGYYSLSGGGCTECGCNDLGVIDKEAPCDPITGRCDCKPGQDKISSRTCDGCIVGFYMNVNDPTQCFSCDCHPYGSFDQNCDLYTGQCDCQPSVEGDKCDECETGYYGLNIAGLQECVSCGCDPEGSTSSSNCDVFGQCQCRDGYGTVNSRTCEGCPAGQFLEDGKCVLCGCDPKGSISGNCQNDGTCFCAAHLDSPKCDVCQSGYYFGDPSVLGCTSCGCDLTGTLSADGECDTHTGQCDCDDTFNFINSRTCEQCAQHQYKNNKLCTDCGCHPKGSKDLQCDFLTGQCPCKEGADGKTCNSCEDGFYNLAEGCIPCACEVENTVQGDTTCDSSGQCNCEAVPAYSNSVKCIACQEGTYQHNGACSPCGCNPGGSADSTCDLVTGQCHCLDSVHGRRCDLCLGDTFGINSGEGCKPCNCNVHGTINKASSCDQNSGQCQCLPGQARYDVRTCDGCVAKGNEFLDPDTHACAPCACLEVGSEHLNCTLYEGTCDCKTGIVGDKCDIIGESQDDVVRYGEPAELSCALNKGEADRTEWIGPDGCVSDECGHVNLVEETSFLSLHYIPEEDEGYKCRFYFGDEYQDHTATVDVITYELSSVRVQKGTELTLTTVVGGLRQEPSRGIEWRHKGEPCTERRCKIDGHEVTESRVKVDGQWTLTSEIDVGVVKESVKYFAFFKYKGKIFRTFSVVTVYECHCDPLGSRSSVCDSITQQCDCKNKFTGINCDQCKDEFYSPSSGCLACDCDTDHALSNLCDKVTGQCACPEGVPFVDTRRCVKCRAGTYLSDGSCVPCGCVTENTVSSSNECNDSGQCDCVSGLTLVMPLVCERCAPGTFLQDGLCKDCGCHPEGSLSLVCDEVGGKCDCRNHFQGDKCDSCEAEFYNTSEGCVHCNCDPDNSLNNMCDINTGQCPCIQENGPFLDTQRCGACADDTILEDGKCVKCTKGTFVEDNVCTFCSDGFYFLDGICNECECFTEGSVNNICNPVNGVCTCKDSYQGHHCTTCQEGYHTPGSGCQECECVPKKSLSGICNRDNGQCSCKEELAPFLNDVTCETCPENNVVSDGTCVECKAGQYVEDNECVYCDPGRYLISGACQPCECYLIGSENGICDKVTGKCSCVLGYTEENCDTCEDEYYHSEGSCKACLCYPSGSLSQVCDKDSGKCGCTTGYEGDKCSLCQNEFYKKDGKCNNCGCNPNGSDDNVCDVNSGLCSCLAGYNGRRCDQCEEEYYPHMDMCKPCECSEPGSLDDMCDDNGQCYCVTGYQGVKCEECQAEYYQNQETGLCKECQCYLPGSNSNICDVINGQCDCLEGYIGGKCAICQDEFHKKDGQCESCGCYPAGASDNDCDVDSGQCTCNPGYTGDKCDKCQAEYYNNNGTCIMCRCYQHGSEDNICNDSNGKCDCMTGYSGDKCYACQEGYHKNSKECVECGCVVAHTVRGGVTCSEEGQCDCVGDRPYVDPAKCKPCLQGLVVADEKCVQCGQGTFISDYQCRDCPCNKKGSKSCDPFSGDCTCKAAFTGDLCDTCVDGFYSDDCVPCNCSPNSLSTVCNKDSGICVCPDNYTGRQCEVCEPGYYGDECAACTCDPTHSSSIVCDRVTGQCPCSDSTLVYKNTRTCQTCPFNHIVAPDNSCVECEPGYTLHDNTCRACEAGTYEDSGVCVTCTCDPHGTAHCDHVTGLCTCKALYTGAQCDSCVSERYDVESGCLECQCAPLNSDDNMCDIVTGQCACTHPMYLYNPRTCEQCLQGHILGDGECQLCPVGHFVEENTCTLCDVGLYLRHGGCAECRCNPVGSLSPICDRVTGECECDKQHEGEKCQNCRAGFYSAGGRSEEQRCEACGCVVENTLGGVLEECSYSGQCSCKGGLVFVDDRTCQTCPPGQVVVGGQCEECYFGTFYSRNSCKNCVCLFPGSVSNVCDPYTAACDCHEEYTGPQCGQCADGYYQHNNKCVPCVCDPKGSETAVCDKKTGQCPCRLSSKSFDFSRTCFNCPEYEYFNRNTGQCLACNCDMAGSHSPSCDSEGRCECLANVEGRKCGRCADKHFGLDSGNGCQPCNCNPYGVKLLLIFNAYMERERDMSCDPVTGQCNCAEFEVSDNVYEKKNKYDSRKCDGCPGQQFYMSVANKTCIDCNCHPEGSRDMDCHLYTGDCNCNPQIVGKYCDTRGCNWGIWEYDSCVLTDLTRCAGRKNRTRKEYITKGGDFSTIIKEAECTGIETTEVSCRVRKPCN